MVYSKKDNIIVITTNIRNYMLKVIHFVQIIN